jgi:hypothetical protein
MLTLLALLGRVHANEYQRCGLDLISNHAQYELSPTLNQGRENLEAREDNWSPLRIHLEYMEMDVDSDQEAMLKDQIIAGAAEYFQSALMVQRLTSDLVLPGIPECIGVSVPEEHQTVGVPADIILYVTAGSGNTSVVGWASYCVTDKVTGQPLAGHFHMETTFWDKFSTEDLLSTAIHEITHVLAFNPSLYFRWRKPDGSNYSPSELYDIAEVRGVNTTTLITPKVAAAAQSHFDCSSLKGVELESSGGVGTAGGHWEKRLMYNEYMVADASIQDVAYSAITLALFEDSGWYKADYAYATPFKFGQAQGCDFITHKCVIDSTPQFSVFCNDITDQSACDFQHLSKGTCNLRELTNPIPPEYQYFNAADLGGRDSYIDYCPVVKAYSNGNCRGIDTQQTLVDPNYGEKACENCRCLEGTFGKRSVQPVHATCHEVECFDSFALVHIGEVTVNCSFTGGQAEIEGFEGFVSCPASSVLCDPMPCMNNCNGIGVCQKGVCQCQDGSVGGDCRGIVANSTDSDSSGLDGSDDSEVSASLVISLGVVVLMVC